jgi:hypothetical protein
LTVKDSNDGGDQHGHRNHETSRDPDECTLIVSLPGKIGKLKLSYSNEVKFAQPVLVPTFLIVLDRTEYEPDLIKWEVANSEGQFPVGPLAFSWPRCLGHLSSPPRY